MTLRAETRGDLLASASCLLAAFGTDEQETEAQDLKAQVGALLIAEAIAAIRLIGKALTTTE